MSLPDEDIRMAIQWYLTVREDDVFKAIAVWQITPPMVNNQVVPIVRAMDLDGLRKSAELNLARAMEVIEAQRASGDTEARLRAARQ